MPENTESGYPGAYGDCRKTKQKIRRRAMTARWISKSILAVLFLAVGGAGSVTVARAGDGHSFQFCYEYDCPKPHFSVLHKNAEPAWPVDRGRGTRSPTLRQRIGRKVATGVILGIDRHRSVVMAKDKSSGHSFQFVVPDRHLLGTLRPGQSVSVNYADMEVSVAPACGATRCPIVTVGERARDVAAQD